MEIKKYRVVSYSYQGDAETVAEFGDRDKAIEIAQHVYNTRHESVSVIDLEEKEIIFSRDVDWI